MMALPITRRTVIAQRFDARRRAGALCVSSQSRFIGGAILELKIPRVSFWYFDADDVLRTQSCRTFAAFFKR